MIYLFESAFPLVHIFLKPALSFSNLIGRVTKTPNAIKAKESVVNLAMPHADEAKAKIDKCMKLLIFENIIRLFKDKLNYLLKIIVSKK